MQVQHTPVTCERKVHFMIKSKFFIVVSLLAVLFVGCERLPGSMDSESIAGKNSLSAEQPQKIQTSRNTSSSNPPKQTQASTVTSVFSGENLSEGETREIQEQCMELATLYADIYAHAEKEPAPYWGGGDVLNQEVIDKIESVFISEGYPVLNSDSVYPTYLEHSEGFYSFWESVQNGVDSETIYWGISPFGGLYYHKFQYSGGKAYYTTASAEWDDEGFFKLESAGRRKVLNWGMTYNNDFYYQDIPTDRHWEASALLRLKPVEQTLYDLNRKYIEPIGYYNINTFLCDWDTSDYGELSFNDLFEYLYRMENGDYVNTENFERESYPYFHYCIPSELFEKTVLTHFEIPLSEFRERALYHPEKDIYPWQDINASNVVYFPAIKPDVTGKRENADGSITLEVHTMCLDMQTDSLFTHEVTIMPDENGSFKYLGNKIIYKGDKEMPSGKPRIQPD